MLDEFTESFRSLPNAAEEFGTIPHNAESFRNVPQVAERKESHTLTVREVSRVFEAAGVARTERSIINWCHPNKLGVCRLDAYFDPNERKHFITPQSVELAIKEEQAKTAKTSETPGRNIPSDSEASDDSWHSTSGNTEPVDVKALHREMNNLRITNLAKDYHIEQLQSERKDFVEKLMLSSHKVGELEARLLRLESPPRREEANVETDSREAQEVRQPT